MKRIVICFAFLFILFGVSGCSLDNSPRLRFGTYPTSTVPTNYLGKNLGPHRYGFTLSEKAGVVYTCNAGHIDIIHVRIAADWTKYMRDETFKHLMKNNTEFSFSMKVEPTKYFIELTYPEDWKSLPLEEKEKIAKEISLELGQYFTYTATTWHEIITWFDFKCIGPLPEFPSAFSWEDGFSNLFGTYIGARAIELMENNNYTFNKSVEVTLDNELEKLNVQPASVARNAAESVKGKWFDGSVLFFVDMKMRNFDIGEDGYIAPTLIPNVSECRNALPMFYPVPNTRILSMYGFSMKLELEPRVWEGGKILGVAGKKERITPETDFPIIMEYIKKDATKRGYIYDE